LLQATESLFGDLISIPIEGIVIFMMGKFLYDLLKLEYTDKKRMIVVAILGTLPFEVMYNTWSIFNMISVGTEGIIRRVISTSGTTISVTVLLTLLVYWIYKRLGWEIPD
jgi:hypothetical protein